MNLLLPAPVVVALIGELLSRWRKREEPEVEQQELE